MAALVMVSWAVAKDVSERDSRGRVRLASFQLRHQSHMWLAYHSCLSVGDARAKVIAGSGSGQEDAIFFSSLLCRLTQHRVVREHRGIVQYVKNGTDPLALLVTLSLGPIALIVDHVLRRRAELCVPFDHLVHRVEEILLTDGLSSRPNSEHPRLGTHTADIRTSIVWTQPRQQLEPNISLTVHRA
jgi:hypothetical protein